MTDAEESIARAHQVLERARASDDDGLLSLTLELSSLLLEASTRVAEPQERQRASRLSGLMQDRPGQVFATALTDRVHRSSSGARLVAEVRRLTEALGVPRSLPRWDRLQLRALQRFGATLPELTARAVRQRIHQDAAPYIVPAESEELRTFLVERQRQNVRVNVNHLGEEVLGRGDEQRYLARYLELLERPEVDTISVKLSSIDSQLSVLAWDRTLSRLSDKLEAIYDRALAQAPPRLVYLDMEAYRELELTFELFCRVLERPGLSGLTAGIVLQAYVPDSHGYQERLIAWARKRVAQGGAPVRMRLVKGANLMMERIEASLEGWQLATYDSKAEVDASFKRMLRVGAAKENARVVRLGVGSHNLFDIAYALVLRAQQGTEEEVEPEMLEGMADPLRRIVQRVAGRVLVYAPSVREADFSSAVAYLVRRLDENTGEENFLRQSFQMEVGDPSYELEEQRFISAVERAETVSRVPRRRAALPVEPPADDPGFVNQPNTDFAQHQSREWLARHLDRARGDQGEVSSRVTGRALGGHPRDGFDPSRPGVVPYRYAVLDRVSVEQAIEWAHGAAPDWARVPPEDRERLLLSVAQGLREARGELIATMVLDAGKAVAEADAEVSEAVDFAEYYARQHRRLRTHFSIEPKGLVVVTPPWNFPLAIALGSVLAALVAGNAVLLKPPPESVLLQARAAELCWRAGIPEEALGLVLVDDEAAEPLIRDGRVALVMLTGGSDTARLFRRLRPRLDLIAETGGKNAVIVSAMSDREQAIAHVTRAAFGHAGQKCSAASLLILEREVFRSATFRRQLGDATRSLHVGSAWDLESVITPLIRPPSGPLARAMKTLDAGESWLVEPRTSPDNPRLLGPGVRFGVAPGSFAHQTELFGPILGVMEAEDFEDALRIANGTPYGLTAGLESLDGAEQNAFLERMRAGNLYINRPITGAVVGRQPFGGTRASSFGRAHKAGGPNTLFSLVRVGSARTMAEVGVPLSEGPERKHVVRDRGRALLEPRVDLGPLDATVQQVERALSADDRERLLTGLKSYRQAFLEDLGLSHTQDQVLGFLDELCYRPSRVLLLAMPGADTVDLTLTLVAARLVGASVTLVLHPDLVHDDSLDPIRRLEALPFQGWEALRALLEKGAHDRLRYLGPEAPEALFEVGLLVSAVDAEPVHASGRIELLRYVWEQSRSIAHHRHGNLGLEKWVPRGVRSMRPPGSS